MGAVIARTLLLFVLQTPAQVDHAEKQVSPVRLMQTAAAMFVSAHPPAHVHDLALWRVVLSFGTAALDLSSGHLWTLSKAP